MNSDQLDNILTDALRNRPLPPAPANLARLAMDIAGCRAEAVSVGHRRLSTLYWRLWVLNAAAIVIFVTVLSIPLVRMTSDVTAAAASTPDMQTGLVEASPNSDELSLVVIGTWIILGVLVVSAVERVMRDPIPPAWGMQPGSA